MADKAIETRWQKYGEKHLLGRKIIGIRYMTPEEADKNLGWRSRPIVLTLDNGTVLYPSQDDEGNDAGSLFGQEKNGDELTFPVLR